VGASKTSARIVKGIAVREFSSKLEKQAEADAGQKDAADENENPLHLFFSS
jgi:hypothetical protein